MFEFYPLIGLIYPRQTLRRWRKYYYFFNQITDIASLRHKVSTLADAPGGW
ncbi:hypothetical protein CIP106467_0601 [Citrobacter europaeus]|nr:hypothetical protein CIP106467_0601 [Citrobacter europaeus]